MSDHITLGILLLSLTSPAWRDREHATHHLKQMPLAWAVCPAFAASPSPEFAHRCATVAAMPDVCRDVWVRAAVQQVMPDYPRVPWVDMIPGIDWQQYVVWGQGGGPEWPGYREGTLRWVLERIEAGDDLETIREQLTESVERERDWIRTHLDRHVWPADLLPR